MDQINKELPFVCPSFFDWHFMNVKSELITLNKHTTSSPGRLRFDLLPRFIIIIFTFHCTTLELLAGVWITSHDVKRFSIGMRINWSLRCPGIKSKTTSPGWWCGKGGELPKGPCRVIYGSCSCRAGGSSSSTFSARESPIPDWRRWIVQLSSSPGLIEEWIFHWFNTHQFLSLPRHPLSSTLTCW